MRIFIGYGYNARDKWIEDDVFPIPTEAILSLSIKRNPVISKYWVWVLFLFNPPLDNNN
jgi:hypothetical protein